MKKITVGIVLLISLLFGFVAPVNYIVNTSGENILGLGTNKAEAKKKSKKKKKTKKKSKKKTKKKKKNKLTKNENKLANFSKSLVSINDDNRAKISKIYNWITTNITYDHNQESFKSVVPYKTYVNRKGVCKDYAGLLSAMLEYVGIKSEEDSGIANYQDDGLGGYHAWNVVKLNGESLYLDATWDEGEDPSDYMYFLIPGKCFSVDHWIDHYEHFYNKNDVINYINTNSAYFDEYCPNLKSRFVNSEEDEDNSDQMIFYEATKLPLFQ